MKSSETQKDALIVFTAAMIVYLATICPTIAAGDSGDLVTAAYTLGIAHPAGYPLYTLLGKLFTLIPYGSIAFRVNLLSAVAAAGAAAVSCMSVRLLTKDRIAAVGAGLAVAFTHELWNQALIAEAYTLNAFFMAVFLYLILLWRREKNVNHLYQIGLAYGLGLANHISLAFFIPFFAYFIVATDRKAIDSKTASRIIALMLVGVSLYAYLPLRAMMEPAYNWGDPSSIDRFVVHVSGFVHRQLYAYPNVKTDFVKRAADGLGVVLRQYSFLWIFALVGLNALRKDRRLLEFTLGVSVMDFTYTVFLNIVSMDITAFEIPTTIIASLWVGVGLSVGMREYLGENNKHKILVVVAAVGFLMASNYGSNNYSNNLVAYDYGMNVLNSVDENAVIFADGDNNILMLAYLLQAEGMRPDVTMIERSGFLSHKVYGNDFLFLPEGEHQKRQDSVEREYIDSGRPVYYTVRRDMEAFPGKTLEQYGLVFMVVDEGEGMLDDAEVWGKYVLRGAEDSSVSKDYMTRDIIATYHTRRGEHYFRSGNSMKAIDELGVASRETPDNYVIHYNLGNIYLKEGMPENAAYEFEKAIVLEPNEPNSHNNLGYAYVKMGRDADAKKEYLKALQIDPGYTKARFNLAGILLQTGRVNEALTEYENIIRIDPSYASAYRNAGGIYYNMGQRKKALEYWSTYVKLEPEDPVAVEIKAKMLEMGVTAE
ncbi:MAG: DUF2723 domain-containing protein [Candidatus Altiarchaeota archaeon]